jgi:hypothetical protein
MRHMGDAGQQPDAQRVKPGGEARWKEHLQAIAERNERAKANGKRERQEREEREVAKRRTEELRVEAEFTRKLGGRYSN